MKILLLGEYSNVNNTLARGFRQLGHQVTVASNGDFWKDYPRASPGKSVASSSWLSSAQHFPVCEATTWCSSSTPSSSS